MKTKMYKKRTRKILKCRTNNCLRQGLVFIRRSAVVYQKVALL